MSSTTTTTEAPTSYSVALNNKTSGNASITGRFNYWGSVEEPQEAELLSIFNGKSPGLRSVACPVTDIRLMGLSSFTLSRNGFQVLQHASSLLPPQAASVPDFHDKTITNGKYWPELAAAVKTQLGLRAAVAVNTTVRDVQENTDDDFDSANPRRNTGTSMQPFFIVHGDYTAPGGRSHFRAIVPSFFEDNENMAGTSEDERREFFKLREDIIAAEDRAMKEEGVDDPWAWSGKNYTGPRWGMLSVWRALEPVSRDPLAVMDTASLFRADVEKPYIALKRQYRDRPGFEKLFRSENPLVVAPESAQSSSGAEKRDHQWYYISHQMPEEVYALKLFDSEAHKALSDVTPWVAHSAFQLPEQENEKPRRSVEIRMIVIW